MSDFDFRTASHAQVLSKARWLVGRTLQEVLDQSAKQIALDVERKATTGHLIEAYFGIPQNSKREADFWGAGIELKTVPVKLSGPRDGKVLERTSVTMVDYFKLVRETWPTASVRKKLSGILFVFCERDRARSMGSWQVLGVTEWRPDGKVEPVLRKDWEYGWSLAQQGRAQDITESAGRIMGLATKGPGGTKTIKQPYSRVEVKPRAWALKASYTRVMLLDTLNLNRANAFDEIEASIAKAEGDFESAVKAYLAQYKGMSLAEISGLRHMAVPRGKGGNAFFVRQLLGAQKRKGRIRQFEEQGIEVKTLRVGPDLKIYEAISFPAFDYWEILDESWEESELRRRLERILFVTLQVPKKTTEPDLLKLSYAFFWSPDEVELEEIGQEWRSVRKRILEARGELTGGASRTKYIHTRPHGIDSSDRISAPGGVPLRRQSFWLNPDYIRAILKAYERGELRARPTL